MSSNPSDYLDLIGRFAQADLAQMNLAVAAAQEAQLQWAKTGLEKRQTMLAAIGDELKKRAAELGELLSREEGKPRAEGVGEVFRAGQFFDYYAAETLRQLGENADSVRDGVEIDIRREPLGVVAVISPWNFPLAAASWKIAPALAFGNAVVWKPSSFTPAISTALAEIFSRQDIPPGLFNLLMGEGGEIGGGLAGHPDVAAVSFTGSLYVGEKIAAAAARNLTKLQMEMGSKNPLLIMEDADMELAVRHAIAGAFGGSGQKCTASSRIIVHRKVITEFTNKMVAATKKIKVGHALEKGTEMGPVVGSEQLRCNLAYLRSAREEGARVLCGGKALKMSPEGYYMSPALLRGKNTMEINRDELFAPIACIISAGSYEEALAIANDSNFGLSAGIITRSLARAAHFRRHCVAGCVMINLPTAGTDYHVPFGGRKQSSHGAREQGRIAAEFYTATKTSYTFSGAPE